MNTRQGTITTTQSRLGIALVTFEVNTTFDAGVGAMIAKATVDGNDRCTVNRYSPAWAIGTGLRVGLEPGEYRITGQHVVNGVPFVPG